MSDSELRQALLGTWRLVRIQDDPDSAVASTGDKLQGYLVYTPDEHMFVQFATRAERSWPGPEVLEALGKFVDDPLHLLPPIGAHRFSANVANHTRR